jgi:crotonobetainyl-CoA:carnitine CoA-transferase CaiB-like acyl-CoA transferase
MTGRSGDPLRAGTSVIDITGGMFGFIGILTALYERASSGQGKFVQAALFETTAFLMGQHMAYGAITKAPVPPMPERVSAWSIYRIFETKDKKLIFIGIISEKHWQRFCEVFEFGDWLANTDLATNNDRIAQRSWFIPALEERLKQRDQQDIIYRCEKADIPFAQIARPEDLWQDPQLVDGHGLVEITLEDGSKTTLPRLPLKYEGCNFDLHENPPTIGQHSEEILSKLGIENKEITELKVKKVIR